MLFRKLIVWIAMVLAGALSNGFEWYMVSWFLTISGPAFLIGALFLWGWHRKGAQRNNLPDKK